MKEVSELPPIIKGGGRQPLNWAALKDVLTGKAWVEMSPEDFAEIVGSKSIKINTIVSQLRHGRTAKTYGLQVAVRTLPDGKRVLYFRIAP